MPRPSHSSGGLVGLTAFLIAVWAIFFAPGEGSAPRATPPAPAVTPATPAGVPVVPVPVDAAVPLLPVDIPPASGAGDEPPIVVEPGLDVDLDDDDHHHYYDKDTDSSPRNEHRDTDDRHDDGHHFLWKLLT